MKTTSQISKKPNKRARNVRDESPQISKKPNKRARNVRDESPQISKKPNKHVTSDYATVNPYDHQPNADKSHFFETWDRGGLNE